MMVIQGADRFGLAQLHQLRGRVGRGTVESFCVLVSDSTDEVAEARLKAVAETHDGFELAEKDFELRQEGDVLGLAQSGFPRLRVASLQVAAHRELAVRARAHAETLLDAEGRMVPPRPALTASSSAAGSGGWWPRTGERRVTERDVDRAIRRRTVPDAGRVIAGTARRIRLDAPGPGTGRSATGSSRPCSRSSSRTCPAPASWTCSRAAARPASRPCRAAPPTRPSSSAMPAAIRVIRTNLERTGLADRATGRSGRCARLARATRPAPPTRPSTSSSSTRRTTNRPS